MFFIFIFGMTSTSSFANKSPSVDRASIRKYRQQCLEIKKFVVKSRFKIDCYNNYQHYNSSARSAYSKTAAKSKGTVKIASYNMLHPGSQRSMFKDVGLMAKVINNWDLVVALELLPVVGQDLKNNQRVLKRLSSAIYSANKGRKMESLYRGPGYITILNELRKLDKSWALILSPRADAAKSGQVEEHVGFFYRGKRVKPISNEHCSEYKSKGDGTTYACLPNLRKEFMGRETTNVFSRRPFIGSFESGGFDFTLVASHIIFGSPTSKIEMKKILMPAFNVSHYSSLGTGATQETYARFAEAAVTLELMENLKHAYNQKDLIMASDFNLRPPNKFWSEVLDLFPGGKLYQELPTTVTHRRYRSNGVASGGLSSSYDHFILDTQETKECAGTNGKANTARYNTYKGATGSYIARNYIIRKAGTLTESTAGKAKRKKRLTKFKKYLKSIYTFKNGSIQWDDYEFEARVKAYDTRIFASQLENKTYHKIQQELLSDHMPITLSCSSK